MNTFCKLSRREQILRFRDIAKSALEAYGLKKTHFRILTQSGNVLFRVYESSSDLHRVKDDPFVPGQYLLRIHDIRGQKTDAIRLDMAWLSAIRKDTGLPVSEPVRALDGNFVVRISTPRVPEKHNCTLLKWVKGRHIIKNIRPHHFQVQGEIMARLHNHASQWQIPKGFNKRKFDYDGLFRDDAGAGIPNSEAWRLLPNSHHKAFKAISQKTGQVMDDWGQGRDVYGLIHGDCGVDANVLFWKGQAHIIDFDDSGFGYYLYDLAIALEHCWEEQLYARYLDSLLRGYNKYRRIPKDQLGYMDLFRAAFYVYMGLWTVAMDKMHPDSPNRHWRHEKWLGYGMRFIELYLEKSGRKR